MSEQGEGQTQIGVDRIDSPWLAAPNRWLAQFDAPWLFSLVLLYATAIAILIASGLHYLFFGWQEIQRSAFLASLVVAPVAAPLLLVFAWAVRGFERTKSRLLQQSAELNTRIVQLQEAQRLWRQAESESAAKSGFLANMSHELRTPLNAVIGFSDAMRQEIFGPIAPARYRDYFDRIHTAGSHLLDIIGDVLDVSRINAGKFELFVETLDLREPVLEAIEIGEGAARSRKVKIARPASPEPIAIRGDRRVLRQIVLNLLSNAVKFSPDGATVSVSVTAGAEGFSVSIRDSGEGISPADLKRLAEPFFQAGDVHTRKHGGTGLGLHLVKGFAALHDGSVEIASEVGRGTVVTVRLPRSRAVDPSRAAA